MKIHRLAIFAIGVVLVAIGFYLPHGIDYPFLIIGGFSISWYYLAASEGRMYLP